jgi:predicted metal-binding membrane protein
MTMVLMVVVMVAMMTSVARCKLGFHDRALEQRTARGTRVPRPYVLVTAHTITALVITALVITALVCNVVGRRFDFQPPAVRTSGGRHRHKGARKPRIQPRLGG